MTYLKVQLPGQTKETHDNLCQDSQ